MTSNSTTPNTGRRRFFRIAAGSVGTAVLVSAFPSVTRAGDLPHLTTDDPTAKALNYTEDASKAPAPHQAGQNCLNCNFFHGGSAAYGPCDLFMGKSVNAKGWCSGYAKKA